MSDYVEAERYQYQGAFPVSPAEAQESFTEDPEHPYWQDDRFLLDMAVELTILQQSDPFGFHDLLDYSVKLLGNYLSGPEYCDCQTARDFAVRYVQVTYLSNDNAYIRPLLTHLETAGLEDIEICLSGLYLIHEYRVNFTFSQWQSFLENSPVGFYYLTLRQLALESRADRDGEYDQQQLDWIIEPDLVEVINVRLSGIPTVTLEDGTEFNRPLTLAEAQRIRHALRSPQTLLRALSTEPLTSLGRACRYDDIMTVIGVSWRGLADSIRPWIDDKLISPDLGLNIPTWVKYTQFWALVEEVRDDYQFSLPRPPKVPSFTTAVNSLDNAISSFIVTANQLESEKRGAWIWPDDHLYRVYPGTVGLRAETFDMFSEFMLRLRRIIKGLNIKTTHIFGEQTLNPLTPYLAVIRTRAARAYYGTDEDAESYKPFDIATVSIPQLKEYMRRSLLAHGVTSANQFPRTKSPEYQDIFAFSDGGLNQRLRSEEDMVPIDIYRSVMREIDFDYDLACAFFIDDPIKSSTHLATKLFARAGRPGERLSTPDQVILLMPDYPATRLVGSSRKRSGYKSLFARVGFNFTDVIRDFNALVDGG